MNGRVDSIQGKNCKKRVRGQSGPSKHRKIKKSLVWWRQRKTHSSTGFFPLVSICYYSLVSSLWWVSGGLRHGSLPFLHVEIGDSVGSMTRENYGFAFEAPRLSFTVCQKDVKLLKMWVASALIKLSSKGYRKRVLIFGQNLWWNIQQKLII
jgi:hypothetical protein